MDETFRSFLWFGVALALVIFGTVLLLGSVSIGEFKYGRESKLAEQVSDLERMIRESQSRVERRGDSFQRLQKSNAKLEVELKEHIGRIEMHEALKEKVALTKENIADAKKERESLLDEYSQRREEILNGVLGTTVEEFTTADGRTFENVKIVRDNGERVSLRSEFGGRSLTYDELTPEMQDLLGVSLAIEELKDKLEGEPAAIQVKPRVVNTTGVQKEEESEYEAQIRNELAASEESLRRMRRTIPHLLDEADRLENEERSKRIKSADVRNTISQLRREASKMKVEMKLVEEEVNDLYRKLHSK